MKTIMKHSESYTKKDNSVSNAYGFKIDSLFSSVECFHVADASLPPYLGHNIFEGLGTYDVALTLKHLIYSERWFTYEELNQRLMTFHYHGTDIISKPCL